MTTPSSAASAVVVMDGTVSTGNHHTAGPGFGHVEADQTVGFSTPARAMPDTSAATSTMLVTAKIHQNHAADPAGTETRACRVVTSAVRPDSRTNAHDHHQTSSRRREIISASAAEDNPAMPQTRTYV